MALQIRRAADRGASQRQGMASRHVFSFGAYLDAEHMAFGALTAVNEDHLAPAAAYGDMELANMEVLTLVLNGALRHEGPGGDTVLQAGDAHRLSAGGGVRCALRNASASLSATFLQIWITPQRDGMPAGEQTARSRLTLEENQTVLIASGDGRDGSLSLQRDVAVSAYRLAPRARDHGSRHAAARGLGAGCVRRRHGRRRDVAGRRQPERARHGGRKHQRVG